MFSDIVDLVKLILTVWLVGVKSALAPTILLTVSPLALPLAVFGWWQERGRHNRLIAGNAQSVLEYQADHRRAVEETHNRCLGELIALLEELHHFALLLCGTDDLTESIRRRACEESGEEYGGFGPLEGDEDLYAEVSALQKMLTRGVCNLEEGRPWDLDTAFYQEWASSLHERYFRAA